VKTLATTRTFRSEKYESSELISQHPTIEAKTMTSLEPRLEALAIKLAAVPFDGLTEDQIDDKISEVTAGLGEHHAGAVVERAIAINRQQAAAFQAEADALESLQRLMRATGCPEGEPGIPWLIERGLIERVADHRYRVLKPGPRASAVK
jgi:hypothetical protein